MEPSKEAIAVRITRLNRQILGKVTGGTTKFNKKTIDREALFDALTVLYDECNDDPVKKSDDLVKAFLDKCKLLLCYNQDVFIDPGIKLFNCPDYFFSNYYLRSSYVI